jgi:hypothetical protein
MAQAVVMNGTVYLAGQVALESPGASVAEQTRTVTVAARRREAVDVGALFGVTAAVNFGIEVVCASECAASLVVWDGDYAIPNISVPIVGCRDVGP